MAEDRWSRYLAALSAAALLASCSLAHTDDVGPAPAPPEFQAVGILADERIADPNRTYVLADGRTFEISLDVTRVLFEGGNGHPFVLGRDAVGSFVAVFASQEGRPAECHIIPAGGGLGIERGLFIETEAVLWRKAADFRSEVEVPPIGKRYAGVGAFCFNEQAEVFAVLP